MCQHINSNEALAENIRPLDTSLTYYLITIVKSRRKEAVELFELEGVKSFLQKNLRSIKFLLWCHELDHTYYQLHAHAIISIDEWFRYMNYNQIGKFHIQWDVIRHIKRDFIRLNKYLHKQAHDKYKQEQLYTINFYRGINGFHQNVKRDSLDVST